MCLLWDIIKDEMRLSGGSSSVLVLRDATASILALDLLLLRMNGFLGIGYPSLSSQTDIGWMNPNEMDRQ